MKTIKIEYLSAFKNETFEIDDMKTAIEICENGINQQYLVYVNGNKYKPMREFGKTINLDDEINKQKFNYKRYYSE